MALLAQSSTDMGDILVISIHAHAGSKANLLKSDAMKICDAIKKWKIPNVLLGGDVANPIPRELAASCDFFDLQKTNNQKSKGGGFASTWRVGKCDQPLRQTQY